MSAFTQRRVVITGLSAVTPIGITFKETWKNLLSGSVGIDRISSFDTSSYRTTIAGEIRADLNRLIDDKLRVKKVDRLERVAKLGVIASTEALKDAGYALADPALAAIGVVVGSGIGGMMYYENQIMNWLQGGSGKVHPNAIPRVTPNTVSGNVSIALGCLGPNLTISTACSSSSHAIGVAYLMIKSNMVDAVLSGGAEAPVLPVFMAAFDNMKIMSKRNENPQASCRPFDSERDGMVLSEGAAMLMLEDRDLAIRRGASIYAEVLGYGQSSGGHHMVIPPPGGVSEMAAMRNALTSAQLKTDAIDYINAHGTSTEANDLNESIAIRSLFGDHAGEVHVSSCKAQTGHLMGASGALGVLISCLSIKEGTVPYNVNLDNPDPKCNIHLVRHQPFRKTIKHALCNSFGFGNNNACLVVSGTHHG